MIREYIVPGFREDPNAISMLKVAHQGSREMVESSKMSYVCRHKVHTLSK